jgi:hypothetical protein
MSLNDKLMSLNDSLEDDFDDFGSLDLDDMLGEVEGENKSRCVVVVV